MDTGAYIKALLLLCLPMVGTAQIFIEEDNPIEWGQYSYVDFDGLTSYLSAPSDSSLSFIEINDSLSIELWIKPIRQASNRSRAIAFQKNRADSIILVGLMETNTAQPYVRFQLGENSYYIADAKLDNTVSGEKLWNDNFYHIVCTYDGSGYDGLKIYINSVAALITRDSLGTPNISGSDSLFIGYNGTVYTKVGYSLARVYQQELSQEQVTELYNSGTPLFLSPYDPAFSHSIVSDFYDGNLKNITTNDIKSRPLFPGNRRKKIYRGEILSVSGDGGFGQASNFNFSYVSPVTSGWVRSEMIYIPAENATYFSTMQRGHIGFSRNAPIYKYVHSRNQLIQVGIVKNINLNTSDGHLRTSIVRLPNDTFLAAREFPTHSLQGAVASGASFSEMSEASTWASGSAYFNLFVLNGDVFSFFRKGAGDSRQAYVKSTNNGDTWGANTTMIDDDATTNWSYPHALIDEDSVAYLFINSRLKSPSFFEKIFVYKTFDMDSLYTLSDSLIGVSATADLIDGIDLINYCLIDSSTTAAAGNYVDIMDSVLDTAGYPHILYENIDVDSVIFASWTGSGWQYTNVPLAVNGDQTLNSAAVFYLGGDNYTLFRIETRDGYRSVVKYETTDAFQTIDSGTVVSRPNINYSYLTTQFQTPFGGPYLIIGSEEIDLDSETSRLWVYEYEP